MAITEAELKTALANGLQPVYVLYGEESYLIEQYTRLIAKRALGDMDDAFHLHRFDGSSTTPAQLAETTELLPMMADYTCVLVRDMDLAVHEDALIPLIEQLPDSCVLVFWQMTVSPDRRKGWSRVFDTVAKTGCVVNFTRKTPADVVKLLVSGAKRRGCTLAAADAKRLLEQAGNDLNLLLCELDKLAAIANGGTITREHIVQLGTKNLEARVFDLSKTLLAGREGQALALLQRLFEQREEPVSILAVLSTAFADIYRVKVAIAAGESATSLGNDFKSYKNKEFRLRNAAAQAKHLDTATLRDCLAILAQADTAIKRNYGAERILLEKTLCTLAQRLR